MQNNKPTTKNALRRLCDFLVGRCARRPRTPGTLELKRQSMPEFIEQLEQKLEDQAKELKTSKKEVEQCIHKLTHPEQVCVLNTDTILYGILFVLLTVSIGTGIPAILKIIEDNKLNDVLHADK